MKYILLFLLLSGCASVITSSDELVYRAQTVCEKEPELDGQKLFCIVGYMVNSCKANQWDIKICGGLLKP